MLIVATTNIVCSTTGGVVELHSRCPNLVAMVVASLQGAPRFLVETPHHHHVVPP
jgi:hypothetical protein